MARGTNNVAFTAPINPPGATPVLTRAQVWACLLLKIRSAETFVPKAIQSTIVLSETTDDGGNPVTTREIVFLEDQRKVKEIVTAYEDCRVEFLQPDKSKVFNIVSEVSEGELCLTYVFEWRHGGASEEEMRTFMEKEKKMSRVAVEGTITAMRELVVKGEI
ncbi:hypothetical protein EG329_004326 [Mollisiaceae sp. DMI_Dod_QoI]|nr:hypothetical protein EG329_004326 [Helotiales sp. DMI_Dod_QoI]